MSPKSDLSKRGLISVIIPCYNYGRFLAQTLDSLISQTYPHWECIIVDDGSTDNTSQVAEQFVRNDSRFRYVYQENSGVSAAKNTGLKNSTGDYIQFLDSDDLIESKKFEQQISFMQQQGEVDILYSNMLYFPSEDPSRRRYCMWLAEKDDRPWMPEVSGEGSKILRELVHGNIMVINSPLLRRTVIEKVGLFDESIRSWEDWDYWLQCAIGNRYFQYDNPPGSLALVRMHPESVSKNTWNMLFNSFLVRKKLSRLLKDPELSEINDHYRVKILKDLCKMTGGDLRKNQRRHARSKLQCLYNESGMKKIKLFQLYALFFPPSLFRRMISFHFQDLKTSVQNQLKKIEPLAGGK